MAFIDGTRSPTSSTGLAPLVSLSQHVMDWGVDREMVRLSRLDSGRPIMSDMDDRAWSIHNQLSYLIHHVSLSPWCVCVAPSVSVCACVQVGVCVERCVGVCVCSCV